MLTLGVPTVLGVQVTGIASIVTLVLLLATSPFNLIIREEWPESDPVQNRSSYDFIIVGAGTAGSVLASRLSENGDWSVLLIEAGEDPSVQSSVPGLAFTLVGTEYDWQYISENDNYASQSIKDKAPQFSAGKMLGGSSSLNLLFYTQGSESDYDYWEEQGNDGWGWDNVKSYFKKFEKLNEDVLAEKPYLSEEFGTDGSFTIERPTYPYTEMKNKLKEAYINIGLPQNEDHFPTSNPFGVGDSLSFTNGGKRMSTAKSHLMPAADRTNLSLIKNALVTKIVMEGKVAKGVLVTVGSNRMEFFANKEVIVSAGAIATPKLLMLSGIGDSKELQKHNIQSISNRPVGNGFKDQILVPVFLYGTTENSVIGNFIDTAQQIWSYLRSGTGLLNSVLVSDLVAFFSTEDQTRPEYEMVNLYSPRGLDFAYLSCIIGYRFIDEICNEVLAINQQYDVVVIHFVLLQQSSSGKVSLRSDNPTDAPIINPGYFSNSTDLDKMGTAMLKINDLLKTDIFKSVNMKILPPKAGNCKDLEVGTEKYWRCIALNQAVTIYHPVGTAKMGPVEDSTSIVDSRLKVHGVKNLRICDASVMVSQISGHPTAAVIMIAEKLSDMIKEEYS